MRTAEFQCVSESNHMHKSGAQVRSLVRQTPANTSNSVCQMHVLVRHDQH